MLARLFGSARRATVIGFTALALVLATAHAADVAEGQRCDACGVVVSISVSSQDESWTPLGVVTSAQPTSTSPGSTEMRSMYAFGSEGSRGMVMVGAAGGAVYARRPGTYQKRKWDVTIRMDGGAQRVVTQAYEPLFREGDRVRVMGTQVELLDT
jgi:outer membrane lipoprotein SlyB